MTQSHPNGIDIAVNAGEPIRSVRDGQVIFAGGDPYHGYGYFVIVQHDQGWSSVYAHLSAFAVKTGEQVRQGQVIGLAGDTGKASGPHLHFELRSFGVPVNPLHHLEPREGIFPPQEFVTYPAGSEPEAPPEAPPAPPASLTRPEPSPTPTTRSLPPETLALALEQMARDAPFGFTVNEGSCSVNRTASLQWQVSCQVELRGCQRPALCLLTSSVCVIEDPLTIWSC